MTRPNLRKPLADSIQSRIRLWMHEHGGPCTPHQVATGIDIGGAMASQVLSNMAGQGMVTRELVEGQKRRYVYALVPGVALPSVATPRFDPSAAPPKPYTPPPAPPRRPVMTAPSLSQLRHDAAVARAAAEPVAAAQAGTTDAVPTSEPITSAAALQRLERTLDLPAPERVPAPDVTATAAPLAGARPDVVAIDDRAPPEASATDELPRHNLGDAIHEAFVAQLERQLGRVVPDPTLLETPAPAEGADPERPPLRCALRSDGCLCIEFTESDETFWLTRTETRILADYLLSFRVPPLERLTAAGITCA